MRLTKQTGHAIRILIDCASAQGALVKVADISDRLDITPQNVFKLVHILSRAGFLAAVRGRHGGVRLARPAADIRIGDVVRATEITLVGVDAGNGNGGGAATQPINTILDDALDAFISVLDAHTLADMAAAGGGKRSGGTSVTRAGAGQGSEPRKRARPRERGDDRTLPKS